MTPTQANEINLSTETNVVLLRKLVKYWQDKAYDAENQLSKNKNLSTEEVKGHLNVEKIQKLM
jgi:hypothetical protein